MSDKLLRDSSGPTGLKVTLFPCSWERMRYSQELKVRSWTLVQALGASPFFDPIPSSWSRQMPLAQPDHSMTALLRSQSA